MDSKTETPSTPGTCPRCGEALEMRDLFTGPRHATVGACPACGGQWMRGSDLERLSEWVEPVLFEWRELPSAPAQSAVMACPACDAAPPMKKLRSERDSRVVVDQCPACSGVWLDANELQAIQQDSLWRLLGDLARRRK